MVMKMITKFSIANLISVANGMDGMMPSFGGGGLEHVPDIQFRPLAQQRNGYAFPDWRAMGTENLSAGLVRDGHF